MTLRRREVRVAYNFYSRDTVGARLFLTEPSRYQLVRSAIRWTSGFVVAEVSVTGKRRVVDAGLCPASSLTSHIGAHNVCKLRNGNSFCATLFAKRHGSQHLSGDGSVALHATLFTMQVAWLML